MGCCVFVALAAPVVPEQGHTDQHGCKCQREPCTMWHLQRAERSLLQMEASPRQHVTLFCLAGNEKLDFQNDILDSSWVIYIWC